MTDKNILFLRCLKYLDTPDLLIPKVENEENDIQEISSREDERQDYIDTKQSLKRKLDGKSF